MATGAFVCRRRRGERTRGRETNGASGEENGRRRKGVEGDEESEEEDEEDAWKDAELNVHLKRLLINVDSSAGAVLMGTRSL